MKKRRPLLVSSLFVLLIILFFLFASQMNIGNEKPDEEVYKPQDFTENIEPIITARETPTPTVAPTPEPTPSFEEYDLSIMALGDNLMHMGVINTGKQEDGSYQYDFLFDSISQFIDAADIKAINQETILGGNELGFSGYPRFNSPTQVGDAIVNAGFNVVTHATNHAADQNERGILNCIDYWKQYPDITMTGIHGDEDRQIAVITLKDISFAILNYTYGPNMETIPKEYRDNLDMLCAYDQTNGRIDFTTLNPQVIEDIEGINDQVDYVVVFPHWGTEYQKKQSSYQEKFALQMTQAGADIIIGTHPHVPQPVEWITSENGNKSLCYYSLGNYVSTQKQCLCMLEEMAWITIHVTETGSYITTEKTGVIPLVCHYNAMPVRMDKVYLLEDYSEDLANQHGIREYGGVTLRYDDLIQWSNEIFGDWILKKDTILGSE